MFLPFLQVLIPTVVFFHESNYWKSIHDFLINSRHSEEILFTQFHIMKNYNHRRSSDKIWAQEGRLFHQKNLSFSQVFLRWSWIFSHQLDCFVFWSCSPKTSKSLMLKVAKVLGLTLFSVRSLKSLTFAFSQIFPVTPILFFKILTTDTKGSIIPNLKEFLM